MTQHLLFVYFAFILLPCAVQAACDSKCESCDYSTQTCLKCIDHAVKNYFGSCECEMYFAGNTCSVFVGKCNAKCFACHGPTARDCEYCVPHATKNQIGECVCDSPYVGEDCGYKSSFNGSCDPRCMGGCVGGTEFDCISCVEHAHKNMYGACTCDDNWTGPDCSRDDSNQNDCDERCKGCTGPSNFECIECVYNAKYNNLGACVCKDNWSGADCSTYNSYSGACNPICSTCTGPTIWECKKCVPNATFGETGICECKDGFSGDRCEMNMKSDDRYMGPCDSKCANGCKGPTEYDCNACVPHSQRNAFGACVCDSYWIGEDCSLSTMSNDASNCHPKCATCRGKSDFDCIKCVPTAEKNKYGQCVCKEGWMDEDCSVYSRGSGAGDSSSNCHPKCDGCTGSSEYNCIQCTSHAQKNGMGACECESSWSGDSCDIFTAPSFDSFSGYGGSEGTSGNYSNPMGGFGYGNPYGGFSTDPMFGFGYNSGGGGSGSGGYGGVTNPIDYDSFGYGQSGYGDSDSSGFGYGSGGQTDTGYGYSAGSSTDTGYGYGTGGQYGGQGTDTGNPYGYGTGGQTDSGYGYGTGGQQDTGYGGYGTGGSQFGSGGSIGSPFGQSGGSTGTPYGSQTGSGSGSYMGGQDSGSPFSDYGGYGQSYGKPGGATGSYSGDCDSKCQTCNGPTSYDCVTCVANARKELSGACTCDSMFIGKSCQVMSNGYQGSCHEICDGCLGPTAYDCADCVANASKGQQGQCVCSPGWTGDSCNRKDNGGSAIQYGGGSNPYGGDVFGYGSYTGDYGSGTQYPGYSGGSGSTSYGGEGSTGGYGGYGQGTGQQYPTGGSGYSSGGGYGTGGTSYGQNFSSCDPICYGGCTGPTAKDCNNCVIHAKKNQQGICVCSQQWGGADCSVRSNPDQCDPRCIGCTGTDAASCISCVKHASRDSYGYCRCDPFWASEDCSTYMGRCNPKCHGCIGPDACDCLECIENAYLDIHGYCVCEQYWSGGDCSVYNGICDPVCKGCTGATASDCLICVPHSHMNNYGFCVCDADQDGADCSIYSGACHITCNGCHGPKSTDCDFCQLNSSFNEAGFCICDNFWTGNSCQNYAGPCDPSCDPSHGCMGPLNSDCKYCVGNAKRDAYGNCFCEEGLWSNDDCSVYIGPCSGNCETCSGPHAYQCLSCVQHAVIAGRQSLGNCICEERWSGDRCSQYIGACSASCAACRGPDPMQCIECVENAEPSRHGGCHCIDGYTGVRCEIYIGECDLRCGEAGCFGASNLQCYDCEEGMQWISPHTCNCGPELTWDPATSLCIFSGACASVCGEAGCSGPAPEDCKDCTAHAVRNILTGMCGCAKDWTYSRDCSMYSGSCNPRCDFDFGCTGPGADDCVKCFSDNTGAPPHDAEEGCSCNQDWTGPSCNFFTGECSKTCHSGCWGPTSRDCYACVPHAVYHDEHGCICKSGYAGQKCEEYIGECSARCSLCNGPELNDCVSCGQNAHFDIHGMCTCDKDWMSSSDRDSCTLYLGLCQPICKNCIGPLHSQCIDCVDNASMFNGLCTCERGWGGDRCTLGVGGCDPTCHGCTGDASDCLLCVEHALWSGNTCICSLDWKNKPDCSQYSGKCSIMCKDTCSGPEQSHCYMCVKNSYRDGYTGDCICAEGWSGSHCEIYGGACPPHCVNGCLDPVSCIPCTESDQIRDTCECKPDWTGPACSLFSGQCNQLCQTCYGPSENNCVHFAEHSGQTNEVSGGYGSDANVRCSYGYTGPDCSEWVGTCHSYCHQRDSAGCKGPTAFDCLMCVKGGYRNSEGACDCLPDYFGESCENYAGACHPMCEECIGPTNKDNECLVKRQNVSVNLTTGELICEHGYTGPKCQIYGETCLPACDGCISKSQCIKCVKNAERTTNETCACLPGYTSIAFLGCTIDQANVGCHPRCLSCKGPQLKDCVSCVSGAYKDKSGICVCEPGYSGDDCKIYHGLCHPHCGSCYGPSEYECMPFDCNTNINAEWDDEKHSCECPMFYNGPLCSFYMGYCSPMCDGCFGPNPVDCFQCLDNAGLNTAGVCECSEGFTGEFCNELLYETECHSSCRACIGPGSNQCSACYTGAFLDDHICKKCSDMSPNCKYCSTVWPFTCVFCEEGYFLLRGECSPCSANCKTCTHNADTCTTCPDEFQLVARNNGEQKSQRCSCPEDMVYLEHWNKCELTCPVGYTPQYDKLNKCELTLGGPFFEFFFTDGDIPVQSASSHNIWANHCNTPTFTDNTRGFWFDGINDTLQIYGAELYAHFILKVYFKQEAPNGTLYSTRIPMAKRESKSIFTTEVSQVLDFYVNSCSFLCVQFGDAQLTDKSNPITNKVWYQATAFIKSGEAMALYLNEGESIAAMTMTNKSSDYPKEMFIGSYIGLTNFFLGQIYAVLADDTRKIQPIVRFSFAHDCVPICKDAELCGKDGLCLSICDHMTYQYGDECIRCHDSCLRGGCTNGEPCTDACHRDCATCNGQLLNDCETCYCNAERSHPELLRSSCTCSEGFFGEPSKCIQICAIGCKTCLSDGLYDCYECIEGYKLADIAPNRCIPCVDDIQDLGNGVVNCSYQGPRLPVDDCSCGLYKWFDGQNCRYCPANCETCEHGLSNVHCTSCKSGYRHPVGSDLCLNFCATGYHEVKGLLTCQGLGVTFSIDLTEAPHNGIWSNTQIETITYTMTVFGGASELQDQDDDPLMIPERGLYFDGVKKLATMHGLTLHHTFGLAIWVRAQSGGTLFSSSRIYDNGVEKSIHFGIVSNDLEFEDKNHYFYWASTGQTVPYNVWVLVGLAAIWEQMSLHTVLEFSVNDSNVGTYSGYEYIIVDYPDSSHTHMLGALPRVQTTVNYFEGFIATIKATTTPYEISNFAPVTYDCIGSCFVCNPDYLEGNCYGFCNWNQYWDNMNGICKQCPSWCRDGCGSEGNCN